MKTPTPSRPSRDRAWKAAHKYLLGRAFCANRLLRAVRLKSLKNIYQIEYNVYVECAEVVAKYGKIK